MREPVYLEDYVKALVHLADAKVNPLRLSRQDELFVRSMLGYTQNLTQPQANLVRTLVQKYKQQLSQKGINADNVLTASPRHGLRPSQDPQEPFLDFDGVYFRFNFTHQMKTYKFFDKAQGTFNLEQGLAYPSLANIKILENYIGLCPVVVSKKAQDVLTKAQRFRHKHRDCQMYLMPDGTITNCIPELEVHLQKKTAGMNQTQKFYWLYDRAYEYQYLIHQMIEPYVFKFAPWNNSVMWPQFAITFEDIKYYADQVGRKYIVSEMPCVLPTNLLTHTNISDPAKPITLADFDLNKINYSLDRRLTMNSFMQFLEDNNLESETLLITNSITYNTKAKTLQLRNPDGKNNN